MRTLPAYILLCALTAVSCSDQTLLPTTPPQYITVSAIADTPDDSRAGFAPKDNNSYSIRWDGSEELSITEYIDGVINPRNKDIRSYNAAAGPDGSFLSFSFDLLCCEGSRFDYYAVNPAGSASVNKTDNRISAIFDIPSHQKQTDKGSPDPNAVFMFAAYEERSEQEPKMCFRFHNAAAYAHITIRNAGIFKDGTVREVSFSVAGKPLAGSMEYLPEEGTTNPLTDKDSGIVVDVSSLDVSCEEFDVWFATAPAKDIDNFTIKVSGEVDGNSRVLKKSVSIPENRRIAFSTGCSTSFTVDMSNAEEESRAVYALTRDGYIKGSGSMPEMSEVLYTQSSGMTGVLENREIGTLTLYGYDGYTIEDIYLRASSSEVSNLMIGCIPSYSFIPPLTVMGSEPVEYSLDTGKMQIDSDRVELNIRNTSDSELTIYGFSILLGPTTDSK